MMAALPVIRINTDAEIRREEISEDQYCVIVDDFLQDPHELVDFAVSQASEFSMPERGNYPGPLFRVDGDAMTVIYQFIRSKMTKQFPFLRGKMSLWTFLSMATMRPDKLSHRQRICHTDPTSAPDRTCYAALVYLFDNEGLGGTGFYRYREPELVRKAKTIEREDPGKARAFLQEHFPTYREPARYMTESNEIAELLCTIPARFNRLIFYSGNVPHSAAITAPELLSTDIRKGRLTLNVFADVLPK
ncbi:MAG: hypothetical protein IH838_11205 [Proteobacteria bacterium]|nr:hypothetical protein [Pseudomonadota bacterium]